MQKRYLTIGFLLLSQFLAAQSNQWLNYTTDYRVEDLLPTDEFVWVSTQGGLVRIDRKTGQRKIFQAWNSGLHGNDVAKVDLAPDGKLWVSSRYGGLYRFDGEDSWEQFYHVGTGSPLWYIQEVEITSEGKMWIAACPHCSCAGCVKLFHFDGASFSAHDSAVGSVLGTDPPRLLSLDTTGTLWVSSWYNIAQYDGINATDAAIPLVPKESITQMAFDRDNTLWVGTSEYISGLGIVYRIRYFDGNTWSELDESNLGGNVYKVNKMFQSPAGDFYISFNPPNSAFSTFAKFDGSAWEYTNVTELPNQPNSPNSYLYTVDKQGHLWFVGDQEEATPLVYEFDGQNWKAYNTEIYPLADNRVYDVAFDCEHNVWFGGSDMLTKFDGVSWKDYTLEDMGISADFFSIWSFTMDTANCNLWISFYDAYNELVSFVKFDGNTFTKYPVPDDGEVFETAIAKDGTVWVASQSAGLGKFNGHFWTWYNEQNSPIPNLLLSVTIDHEQNVWITAGGEYAIMRWDGTTLLKFDPSNAPVSKFSDWVFVDYTGLIWTSGENGLLRFNGVVWDSFPVPSTEAQGIYRMAQDQEHNFWLSNYGGLHKWDGNSFESYNFIDHPLGNGFINRIRIDPFGNKWLAHPSFGGATVFNENGISNQIINPIAGARGTVYFDANQDGIQGQASAEPGIPNEKVYLKPENTAIFTNHDGNYTLFPPPGNYQLSYTGSEDYTPTSTQSLPLNMGTNELNGFNFGAWSENTVDSISLDMTVGNIRCNEEVKVWLSLVGCGMMVASGDITLQFDPALTFLHANPVPDLVEGNLLTWHYAGLSMYELMLINVVFKAPGVDAVGQILSLQSDATVLEGGVVTASAEKDGRAEVRCSFDPNDKASASVGLSVDEYSLLNDALDFTIRFQNSGNDTAFTVILRDTLDANLDFSTLQIVASSHPMRATLTSDGVLTFVFDDINLLWESVDYAGSQGFLKYRISPMGNLPDPTAVRNTAHIFFDFNPAIVTNTTLNVLVETLPFSGTAEIAKPNVAARLYPNPNTGDFWIEWLDHTPAQKWQISIVDMLGRSCFQSSFDQKLVQVHDLAPGFFFVFLEKGGKVECHKLLVNKDLQK